MCSIIGSTSDRGTGPVGVVDLEPDLAVGGLDGPIEVEGNLARLQDPFDLIDVQDRHLGAEQLFIAARKRVAVAAEELLAPFLSMGRHQRFLKVVGP